MKFVLSSGSNKIYSLEMCVWNVGNGYLITFNVILCIQSCTKSNDWSIFKSMEIQLKSIQNILIKNFVCVL